MDDKSNALLNFEKSLKIYLKFLSEDNFEIATIYSYIGAIYKDLKDYTLAL
jgi:hypothetical protein